MKPKKDPSGGVTDMNTELLVTQPVYTAAVGQIEVYMYLVLFCFGSGLF